jgi:peptidoglycan/LPS O-acetylase OafA/YrhL
MAVVLDQEVASARPGAPRRAFRTDIEGLRAVAVGAVVLYHAWPAILPGGFVGVDVFFVISGFLITGQLMADRSSHGHHDVARFYARRIRRILPASTLVLIVTVIVAWQVEPAFRASAVSVDSIWASLFAINYHLAEQSTNYLNASSPVSPLQNYWSLSVEEQFYLLWPVILIACSALAARRATRSPHRRRPLGAVWLSLTVVLVGSFLVDLHLTQESPPWAYFSLFSRGWELAAGALVFMVSVPLARLPSRVASGLTWVGLIAIVAAALAFGSHTAYPGTAALLPVAGTMVIIAAGCCARERRRGADTMVLNRAPFQSVGRLSYSWYLWHFPALILAPAIFGVATLPVAANLAVALASLVVAGLCYRYVENPIRHLAILVRRPRLGLLTGLALVSLAVLVAAVMPLLHPQPRPSPPARGSGLPPPQTTAEIQADLAHALRVTTIPSTIHPSLADAAADEPVLYHDGCHVGPPTVTVPDCVFGDLSSPTTVILFGDSHAAQWFPALEAISVRQHWRLVSMTKSSCPAVDVSIYNAYFNRTYHECDTWRTNALKAIRALHPALVVLANRRDYGPTTNPDDSASFVPVWEAGVRTTLQRLRASAAHVVFLEDTPHVTTSIPVCLSTPPGTMSSCEPDSADADYDAARQQADRRVASAEGVGYVDPTPWFCTADGCPAVVGDILVYRDEQHMTVEYSLWLQWLLQGALLHTMAAGVTTPHP